MEKLQQLLDKTSTITTLEQIGGTDSLPVVCRIVVESRLCENSLIRSVIWLPENWNGIFVGLGNSGTAGGLGDNFWEYAVQGYAIAQSDMGTSRLRSGELTEANAELWKDYAWRSTHLTTEIAKTLLTGYYGRKADYSYFIGASAGGLQAFSEAQRFPSDYDGIIAGVPSNNVLNLMIYGLWGFRNLHSRDGKGKLSLADGEEISRYAAEYFNARGDGEKGDNFVTYPYTDEHTAVDFLRFLHEKAPHFTDEQLHILKTLYDGPKNRKTGEQIFCGLPIGSERNNFSFFGDSDTEIYGFPWIRLFFGKGYDDWDFDFADDYETMYQAIGKDFSANDANLAPFFQNGSKFLVYSGASDPIGPWPDAMKYYNRVCAELGGYETVSEFFRFFILPGKAHGDTGLGVNCVWGDEARSSLLDTMRKWRETGNAPETLTGAHIDVVDGNETVRFTRNVTPYRGDKVEGKDFPFSTSDRLCLPPQ